MDDVRDFVRRYAAAWASREPGVMAPLWHDDGELHHPALSASIPGERVAANNDNTKTRLPDFEWWLLDWAAQGNVVYLHWRNRATIGGRRHEWTGVDRMELRDGRIEREDVYFDTVPLRQALDPGHHYAPLVKVEELGAETGPEATGSDPVRENVALIERYYEAWGGGEPEAIAELFAEDFEGHVGGADLDLAALLGARSLLAKSFPDQSLTTLDVVADRERVAARWRSDATFAAEFNGIEPTNERVRWHGVTIYRIRSGRIAELWDFRDRLAILEQLQRRRSSG